LLFLYLFKNGIKYMSNSDSNAFYHSKLGVRSYDLFNMSAHQNGPVRGDIDFYISCAQEFGGPVLELATGTGRVLWPIAAIGFEIVGVDISETMLAQARQKAARETSATRQRVRLCQMDMTSFVLGELFQLAIVPFRAFHHLTNPEQQRRALSCINRSLIPNGHLVVDLLDPRLEYCVPGAPPPVTERIAQDPSTGHTMVRRVVERINDPVRQIFTEKFRIEELDEYGRSLDSEETSWSFRWAPRQEMRYLFELTGFGVVAEYSDFFRSPPVYGAEQLWVVQKIG
jgi:ubiquinone/menaquinone biosynthesis C-methylase UbiE